jgi:signal peptidase I
MENTLFANDVIMVNKIKYGPRLPRSPLDIPFINIFYHFNDDTRKQNKEYCWPYKRLSGTTSVKQGDVMVFNSTWNKNYIIVKRCVALSGDTLEIKNTSLYINNKNFNTIKNVKYNYQFSVLDKKALYNYLDSLNLNKLSINKYNSDLYQSILSQVNMEALKKSGLINNVKVKTDTSSNKKVFFKSFNNWSFNNMGPILIPKKGMQITLNLETFSLYQSIINSSENCKTEEIDGVYYINDKRTSQYTFKYNYYFMMGDNRDGTMDSRTWGFVPEQNIIGKVQCVLYSNYKDKFQWGRLLKHIN